ncbi:MAG: hypothetical protein K8S23_07870 [Candidatus Cloacimonetes bacterium]|nr:hypothetical protein [Candidatus Cloacimonadota bacterium]
MSKSFPTKSVFLYRIINDKPFYFLEENGKISILYGDKIYPTEYEDVIHYKCCEPGAFNIRSSDYMVCFYALKRDYWYYVEAGNYD